MLEQLNTFFKKIFSNEETIIFSFAILAFFIVISFFWISINTLYGKYCCCLLACRSPEENSIV